MLEEILQEIETKGNIRFSSYTKPLIAVEDVVKIIRAHAGNCLVRIECGDGQKPDSEKYRRRIREMIEQMDEKDLEKVYASVHRRFINRMAKSIRDGGSVK